MNKRIGILINRMNFRPSSGHGIFIKGVVETLTKRGHVVDIISDAEPEYNFLESYDINVYTPDTRYSYTPHNDLFQFGDSFNLEKSINFRNAINKALTHHTYDVLICNDAESAFVCYQLGLHEYINVCHYAHECASINKDLGEEVFKDCYYDLINHMMYFPITTLIQTEQNKSKILKLLPYSNPNLYVQPYPLTDSTPITVDTRDGLLFIGRYEERKNPQAFIKVLAGIKEKYGVEVKAKVLTRSAHVKKFEADFASIGHTNYEIKADVVGEEKARIIQSSKVAFMPYKNESFGIAVLEALRFMPTVVLDKFDWHYNFEGMSNLIVTDQKEMTDVIWTAYNTWVVNEDAVEKEFQEYQNKYENALLTLVESDYQKLLNFQNTIEPRFRLYAHLKENEGKWVSLNEYYKNSVFNRNQFRGYLYINNDVELVYKNSKYYQFLQTKEATYLGIPDANGKLELPTVIKETEAITSFFE